MNMDTNFASILSLTRSRQWRWVPRKGISPMRLVFWLAFTQLKLSAMDRSIGFVFAQLSISLETQGDEFGKDKQNQAVQAQGKDNGTDGCGPLSQ